MLLDEREAVLDAPRASEHLHAGLRQQAPERFEPQWIPVDDDRRPRANFPQLSLPSPHRASNEARLHYGFTRLLRACK